MVALPEHFAISVISWERRGMGEGEGKEQQYPEWVQSSREERSIAKEIHKVNSEDCWLPGVELPCFLLELLWSAGPKHA